MHEYVECQRSEVLSEIEFTGADVHLPVKRHCSRSMCKGFVI